MLARSWFPTSIADEAARDRQDLDRITQWQLGILSFAITRSDADRALVDRLACQLDLIGTSPAGVASFFRRTSTDVCRWILADKMPDQADELRRFFSWIDEPRLGAAFLAATGLIPEDRASDGARHRTSHQKCDYDVVIAPHEGGAWGWEVRRNGSPLAVRLRDGGFKSERTATASAKVALHDFLNRLKTEMAINE